MTGSSASGTPVPIASIVIPCYSVPAEHVREAIDSVISQTISDWEAIVVDDGGAEFSLVDLVASIGDNRVRVVKHAQNLGLGAARNTGFREATAPLVAMLDADDQLHPDYLRQAIAAIQDGTRNSWVWPDIEVFGESVGEWRFPDPPFELCPAHLNYRGGSSLIPVTVWEAVGGFVEDPLLAGLEDMDFWLGALEIGGHPTYVHELLYQWRVTPSDSMTFRVSSDNHLQVEAIFGRRRSLFERALPCPDCLGGQPGAIFRARGYFNSSVHARRSGRRLRSLILGLRAWFLNPTDTATKRHLASLIPGRASRSVDQGA